jgi:hypothetical protein
MAKQQRKLGSWRSPGQIASKHFIKRSEYQPARSSDILLQEFVAKGVNEADIATDYESIALSRWGQQNIPWAQVRSTISPVESPPLQTLQDISCRWERAQEP